MSCGTQELQAAHDHALFRGQNPPRHASISWHPILLNQERSDPAGTRNGNSPNCRSHKVAIPTTPAFLNFKTMAYYLFFCFIESSHFLKRKNLIYLKTRLYINLDRFLMGSSLSYLWILNNQWSFCVLGVKMLMLPFRSYSHEGNYKVGIILLRYRLWGFLCSCFNGCVLMNSTMLCLLANGVFWQRSYSVKHVLNVKHLHNNKILDFSSVGIKLTSRSMNFFKSCS